jgi:Spy/CpxP family protein refolding chaperone
MKRQLITLAIASGLAFASAASVSAQPDENGGGWHGHGGHGRHGGGFRGGNPMEHLTKDLDLTPDQQAKVQPIVDQAKPQIQAIHQDAMQKTKAVMDNTMAQIRPLLTPEQQQKLETMRAAHEKMREARQEMRAARRGE